MCLSPLVAANSRRPASDSERLSRQTWTTSASCTRSICGSTLASSGLAASINGSSVSLGGSITVASTTLLANNNTWSGNNIFSNLLSMNGLTSYASSTIGNGTQAGGLTISGGATTTGNLLVQGGTGAGTSLDVNGTINAWYYNVGNSTFIDNNKDANIHSVSINSGLAVIDSSGKAVFAQATTSALAITGISSSLLKT